MDAIKSILEKSDLVYDNKAIKNEIVSMSERINNSLEDKEIIAVCVMNGALPFFGDLVTNLEILMQFDYVHATRYHNNTSGSILKWIRKPSVDPDGHDVLIIDDILDEGYTLSEIVKEYKRMGAKNVYTAVLTYKEGTQKTDLKPDFIGLKVPNSYVFGYGMDYKGYYRNLPAIYALRENK